MENEKSKNKINEVSNRNNTEQNIDSELKRFKSHETYLVNSKNAKKPQKNGNISKDHKKIFINISQADKINPKPRISFNNSNNKPSKLSNNNNELSSIHIIEEGKQLVKKQKANKSKSKTVMGMNNKNKNKLTVNNYVNSINGQKNKINTSKILNEESIQELDSEDNNNALNINKAPIIINNSKISNTYLNNNNNKAKHININNKNNCTNNINMNLTNNYFIENNGKNRIIKKINFDEFHNSSNKNNNNMNLNETLKNTNKEEKKNRELLIISKKGDKEKLLELLSSNQININFQNENGWSALHYSCDEGNLKIVDILIKSKIDLNLKTNEKKTPLHIAVLRGYFDISKLLIENGANINTRDNEKNLPVHICASQGHDELLNFILEKNSTGVKVKNLYGKTPLDLAIKESTKEIIKKFMNLKKNNIIRISDKDKNSVSPKIHNGNNIINYNYNHLNNNKNQFSRIKIHKTNKSQIKSLMIPISSNHHLNKTINNNDNINNIIKTNNGKNNIANNTNKGNTINANQGMNISINLNNNNNIITENTYNTLNINSNGNDTNKNSLKNKANFTTRKYSSSANQDIKPNKVKIDLSSSTKNNNNNNNIISNINNNNSSKNSQNNKNNQNNNFTILSNNTKYISYASNKRKVIFNIHISCNNNTNNTNSTNKSNSPSKDSFMRFNTSTNMTSSSKKIYSNNNSNKINEFLAGNDIFFGNNEKEKVRGKIINIPKKVNNKKENRSQSKKKKVSSVWKTVTQTDRITPKFSPNIKCIGKPKKKMALFKKEDSKIMNNLSSKRTVSVPRFLDTESILEKPSNKKGFKREESSKNKFKVPKRINNDNSNSNHNKNNKNKEINNIKGKVINNGLKNMRKQNSNNNNKNNSSKNNSSKNNSSKNNKFSSIGIKNRQIYTEEDANLIEDLEEETIIEIKKDKEKDKNSINKNIPKKASKEIKDNKNLNNNLNINNNNNNINTGINDNNNYYAYGNEIKNQTLESDDEFDNIEELEDSFDDSDDSDVNKDEKIGPSNFICLALLGQGSFGEVYLVKKKDSDDFYAMKVLDKCRIAKQNIFKYVLTERNVLSVMHNPFIVKLNYAFQTSEKLFLLLDYCPGGDLSKQLQIQTRFSEEKAKFYICEIILALGELHKNNIIFRDLKPDNVVIDKEGHALLTDFGLSREGVVGKEIAKSFCGSIAYLAPEMLNRCGHGKAVDWYLLGVLFYELLVGVPPYFTANQEQIFKNIQKAELYIPPFVSDKAQNLIRSLLKRNPNERLGSKRDVEEIKEDEYFSDVDWQKVYERKYKPPQIYLKSNHLQFFRQPVQFKENEEDDLFVKDSNVDYNKYNQDILYNMNNYEGWSFVQKNYDNNNAK